jgi:hypothetical protein
MGEIWNWDNITVNNIVNIFQSVDVYTGYVVTHNEGNIDMAQYYI